LNAPPFTRRSPYINKSPGAVAGAWFNSGETVSQSSIRAPAPSANLRLHINGKIRQVGANFFQAFGKFLQAFCQAFAKHMQAFCQAFPSFLLAVL